MLIHRYDTLTGQYLSSVLADEDPQHPGRWLIPAWSTPDPLPERLSGTWPFYRNGAWTLLPDYRGRVLYRRDTGAVAEIMVAGVSPEEQELTDQPRPSDDYIWRADGWALNPAAVARKKHGVAIAEFAQRMEHARRRNVGKSDAYAAGLLDDEQIRCFKAWSAYQMALVLEIEKDTFPEDIVWPEEPGPCMPIDRNEPSASTAAADLPEAIDVRDVTGMDKATVSMSATNLDDAKTAMDANEVQDMTDTADTVEATNANRAGKRRPRRRPASDAHAD